MDAFSSQALAVVAVHALGAAVVALVVASVSLKVRHASVAHVLWVVVLAKLLTPPFFGLAVLPAEPAPEEAYETVPSPLGPPKGTVAVSSPFGPPKGPVAVLTPSIEVREAATPFPWTAALLSVLASGTLLVLGLAAWRLARFRRVLGEAREAGEALAGRVAELSGRLGLRRPPRLRIVERRISPLVMPRLGGADVVLPAALLSRLGAEELDAVLVHELAHLRRRDHWVRGLELLATALFWWHPVLWWARRNLRRAEERCCDLWVAHVLPGCRRAYAEGLLKTLELMAGVRTALPATATGMDVREDMKERLTMILTERTPKILTPRHRWLLAAMAVALLVVVPTRADRAAGDGEQEKLTAEEEHYRQERLELERRELALQEEMRALELDRHRLDYERESRQRELELERTEAEASRLEAAGQAEEAERLRQELEHQRTELELAQREYELERNAMEEIAPLELKLREESLRSEELEGRGDLAQAEELRRQLAEEKRRMSEILAAHDEERVRLQNERIERRLEVLQKREQELQEAGQAKEAQQVARQAERLRLESEMAELQSRQKAKQRALEAEGQAIGMKLRAAELAGHEEQFRDQQKLMLELEAKARALETERVEAQEDVESDRLRALVAELKAHQEEVLAREETSAAEKERIAAELQRLKERLADLESRSGEEEE